MFKLQGISSSLLCLNVSFLTLLNLSFWPDANLMPIIARSVAVALACFQVSFEAVDGILDPTDALSLVMGIW